MAISGLTTFLDAYGNNLYTPSQYAQLARGGTTATATAPLYELFTVGATLPKIVDVTADASVNTQLAITVGLVLDRAHDPTALLSGNWAQRQAGLSALQASGGPWATYGADPATYSAAQSAATAVVGQSALSQASSTGYLSTPADRTIWLSLTPQQFTSLFGPDLYNVTYTYGQDLQGSPQKYSVYAWTGSLSLPSSLSHVSGLWFEQNVLVPNPNILDSTLAPPTLGVQGIGNANNPGLPVTPAGIAANYHFPSSLPTDPIALVEANVPNQASLFTAYNQYRHAVGLQQVGATQFQILSGTDVINQSSTNGVQGELTLDISVIAGAAPNSTQLLYADLGGTPFNAYQQAFFDAAHSPAVLSSSFPVTGQARHDSPFMWAWQQLFVDGALANVSVHIAGGDEGASNIIANGIANLSLNHSSPFTLIVGGTSIAGLYSALSDYTLTQMVTLAQQDDPGTVFQLVASGLRSLPTNLSGAAPASTPVKTLQELFETVWQTLSVTPTTLNGQPVAQSPYGKHATGSGGISLTEAIPSYQKAFGLSSLTNDHRGSPDVAALSLGDSSYSVLNPDYVNGVQGADLLHPDGGTSAAAPLWASLTAQFNAIFHDQGLPNLGYYNDLLYIAAAIAPASFNDVQLGNNFNTDVASVSPTAYYNTFLGLYMTPTGQGYSAGPGYDLATGLGTPNGTLLARALTEIAHQQVSFSKSPPLLTDDGHGGWKGGTDESVLLQATTPGTSTGIDVLHGGQDLAFASAEPGSWAWTARLAQQSLQADFDPGLAVLFDKQPQGMVTQTTLHKGESLSVLIGSGETKALQASLTTDFGFADFFAGNETLHAARPVAVAETVGGLNDQTAILRIRQVGQDSTSLTVYRVDDYSGSIGNLHPGDAGYQQAIQGRAYLQPSGAPQIGGPGYGQFQETPIQHVNAGDLIAFKLTNNTHGTEFLGFTEGNETVGGQKIMHLINYGANTWGFEDTWGGGDHDFNDLVFQIDFTSAYGHGWLA